jgi:hypothetical protein
MPLIGSARAGFLKGQFDDPNRLADSIAAHSLGEVDKAFLEQRVAVVSGPNPNTAYH